MNAELYQVIKSLTISLIVCSLTGYFYGKWDRKKVRKYTDLILKEASDQMHTYRKMIDAPAHHEFHPYIPPTRSGIGEVFKVWHDIASGKVYHLVILETKWVEVEK